MEALDNTPTNASEVRTKVLILSRRRSEFLSFSRGEPKDTGEMLVELGQGCWLELTDGGAAKPSTVNEAGVVD